MTDTTNTEGLPELLDIEQVVDGDTSPTVSDDEGLTFWHTKDDAPVLCTKCAIEELNSSFAIQLGLVEPFTSMQNAIERFADPESINEPDYFIEEPTGTCVECGASA